MALVVAAGAVSGCAVGQKPGKGEVRHVQKLDGGGEYYLYLPEDYVADKREDKGGRKWPLVVTFHGMKPFDSAAAQIREWQQEADRYGYVVIAPKLSSPDLLKEFPLRHVHPGVRRDEKVTIAAMDDVARRVNIDPDHVLSTSWSSGGYIAHYMANRYPERFSCIAPRQSNFSAAVLDPDNVDRYRKDKVGIFYTQNDFAICRKESQEAARWYSRHGFDVTFAVFQDLGHERRPGVAAAFFAKTCGATAKSPPTEIARMQAKQIPQLASAIQASPVRSTEAPAGSTARPVNPAKTTSPATRTVAQSQRFAIRENRSVVPRRPGRVSARSPAKPAASPPVRSPLQIRLSSDTGVAPLLVNFSAQIPTSQRRGAYFLWTSNGMPISNGTTGRKLYTEPGKYVIGCLMTTESGATFNAEQTVRVLDRRTARR